MSAPPTSPAALLDALVDGPLTWSTAAGLVLPLVVGLITTDRWQGPPRGLLLLALSLVLATTDVLTGPGPFDWRAVLVGTLTTWWAGHVAHGSVWRGTPLSRRLQDLGSPPPAHDETSVSDLTQRLRNEREPTARHARYQAVDDPETRTLPDR